MFIPYGTDAPIYHWPRGTAGLVAVNVAVYALAREYWHEAEPYMLAFGQGLRPLQWLTYSFLNPSIPILIMNMLFLGMFGIIVEGKLGTIKFLAVYLGLAVLEAAIEQGVLFAHVKGWSISPASLIFSLMAMNVVWAPKNDVSCIFVWSLGFRIIVKTLELPIIALACFYLLSEVIEATLIGMIGTVLPVANLALMNLIAVVLGFGLATLLLKADLVDCENWDLFTVLAGRHTRSGGKAARTPKKKSEWTQDDFGDEEDDAEAEAEAEARVSLRAEALEKMNAAVQQEHAPAALVLYRKFVARKAAWEIPEPDHLALIKLLLRERLGQDLVPILERYLAQTPKPTARLRLVLARTLIRDQQRPAHGARVLEAVAPDRLSRPMQDLYRQLQGEAHQMREDGVLELDGEGW